MQKLIDANKVIKMIEEAKVSDEKSRNFAENIIRFSKIELIIPDNPTNGDIQKAILPKHWEYGTNGKYVHVWGDGQTMTFILDWWNAPFKMESENNNNGNDNN